MEFVKKILVYDGTLEECYNVCREIDGNLILYAGHIEKAFDDGYYDLEGIHALRGETYIELSLPADTRVRFYVNEEGEG